MCDVMVAVERHVRCDGTNLARYAQHKMTLDIIAETLLYREVPYTRIDYDSSVAQQQEVRRTSPAKFGVRIDGSWFTDTHSIIGSRTP